MEKVTDSRKEMPTSQPLPMVQKMEMGPVEGCSVRTQQQHEGALVGSYPGL
jgi:hypothetical protein